MSLAIATDVRQAMLEAPQQKLTLEKALGGFRIVSHDGRVVATGSDVAMARDLVEDHNKQVEKNCMTGAAHL